MGKTVAALTRCTNSDVAKAATNVKRMWMTAAREGLERIRRLHPDSSLAVLLGDSGAGVGFQSVDASGIDPNFVLPDSIRRPRLATKLMEQRSAEEHGGQAAALDRLTIPPPGTGNAGPVRSVHVDAADA